MGLDTQREGASRTNSPKDRLTIGGLARFSGLRIWDQIMAYGTSRAYLAKACGMHETNLKDITEGLHIGTKATLDRIAEVLEIDVSHFFGGPVIRNRDSYMDLDDRLNYWVSEYFEECTRNENVMLWLSEKCEMKRAALMAVLRGRSRVSYPLMLSLANLGVGYVGVVDMVAPIEWTAGTLKWAKTRM